MNDDHKSVFCQKVTIQPAPSRSMTGASHREPLVWLRARGLNSYARRLIDNDRLSVDRSVVEIVPGLTLDYTTAD
jgi:hypothetical protein